MKDKAVTFGRETWGYGIESARRTIVATNER